MGNVSFNNKIKKKEKNANQYNIFLLKINQVKHPPFREIRAANINFNELNKSVPSNP